MPRWKSLCTFGGCYEEATNGTKCDDHAEKAARQFRATRRVYDSPEHRQFRTDVLRRDRVCVLCRINPATRADHYPHTRKQLVAAGLDPNDPAYGRGLCASCDGQQTARRTPGGWADTR